MDTVDRSWQYFKILEHNFIVTTAYVDVDLRNYEVFSDQFRSLLILLGAEIDATCKFVCKQANPASKADNIRLYRNDMLKIFPFLYLFQVRIPQYDIMFAPWLSWYYDRSPTWWHAYNDVKHDRHKFRTKANLFNVMQALSGLFCLQIIIHLTQSIDPPSSALFTWINISSADDEYVKELITQIECAKTDLLPAELDSPRK